METFLEHKVLCWDQKDNTSSKHRLIGEEPLSIRIEGKPYSVVMRTPGDELAHAAGFQRSDTSEQKLDKLEPLFPGDKTAHALLASLLSLPVERYPALGMSPQKQKDVESAP